MVEMCRSSDLGPLHRDKTSYVRILAIIPGPDEPKNMAPYIQPLLEDLKRYGPGSEGEHANYKT